MRWVYRGRESAKAYEKKVIGQADDFSDADGLAILTYDQAQAKTRALKKKRSFAEAGIVEGAYTVRRCIDDYVAFLKASGKDHRGAHNRAYLLIIPSLGDIEVSDLTSARLRKWLSDTAHSDGDEEAQRRRKATANRVMAILKAALNHAYDERCVPSNDAWGRRVKPFRSVERARQRYLSVDEAQRLINASQGAFRHLVQAALQTGCRFGELTRLLVRDFERETGTIHVTRSKSGKARHVVLTDEGVNLFTSLCAGRQGDEHLLGLWSKTGQHREMVATVARAKIDPITFHGLRHTWASLAVMNGVPLQIIAQNLGHSDTRMVERHYGHMGKSFVADAIRAGAPRFEG